MRTRENFDFIIKAPIVSGVIALVVPGVNLFAANAEPVARRHINTLALAFTHGLKFAPRKFCAGTPK